MDLHKLSNIQCAGIGLRMLHFQDVLHRADEVPWVELLLDNWLYDDGVISDRLKLIVEAFPVTCHGVGLSIASSRPVDVAYLAKVKRLLEHTEALAYSEHLSFSQTGSQFIPDLLPFPYTEDNLRHVADKIDFVQNFLGRQILMENVSAYIDFPHSAFSEEEFIYDLVQRTGCGLLLDVNNMYVNQVNLGRDARSSLEKLPLTSVAEIHLGGHEVADGYLIDAHNNAVCDEVWEIYQQTIELTGPVASLIEWDNDIPAFDVLIAEKNKAQGRLDQVLGDGALYG